jgi:hypothetical protein
VAILYRSTIIIIMAAFDRFYCIPLCSLDMDRQAVTGV